MNRSAQQWGRPSVHGAALQSGWQWSRLIHSDAAPNTLRLGNAPFECFRSAKLARVEAALFVASAPLSLRKLVQLATLADVIEARQLIEQLNRAYERSGSAFVVESVAGGARLMTRPQFSFWLRKVHHRQAEQKLTPPALETLAIVAYRQPVTRAEIEQIRGVQCVDMIKQLMDRELVRIAGEENSLGRPFLYETTRTFLELFGLANLEGLPMAETLRRTTAATTKPGDSEPAAA